MFVFIFNEYEPCKFDTETIWQIKVTHYIYTFQYEKKDVNQVKVIEISNLELIEWRNWLLQWMCDHLNSEWSLRYKPIHSTNFNNVTKWCNSFLQVSIIIHDVSCVSLCMCHPKYDTSITSFTWVMQCLHKITVGPIC